MYCFNFIMDIFLVLFSLQAIRMLYHSSLQYRTVYITHPWPDVSMLDHARYLHIWNHAGAKHVGVANV